MNFWQKLPKPFFVLAPMEDVTDFVFREIVIKYGKPDVLYTEFTNVEGLSSIGRKMVEHRLQFSEHQRPIVAQIWGEKPENFREIASYVADLGFDGIDLNMGCPVPKVIKKGHCSALIKNPTLAKEIVLATIEGSKNLPVSVKTRIGFNKIVTEEWTSHLFSTNIDALILHGRTTKEMSKVPCHWDEIGKAVKIRNELSSKTLLIGNGDVKSVKHGKELLKEFGVDGIMIGRGIFGNPWLFNESIDQNKITPEDKLKVALEHTKLFVEHWGNSKNFNIMKKFYKAYVSGFDGASEIRDKLMRTKSYTEVEEIILKLL